VLRRAVDLGVNHIDTAAFYFSPLRSANELINRALGPYADGLVIATKVGPARGPGGDWRAAATPAELRGQVEENLRQLGRDHLDVVNLRVMQPGSISDHFGALAQLRDAGLIRHLGLSNIKSEHLAEAQAIAPVVCVQNRFGLAATNANTESLLRTCGEQGIAFVPFYAIAGARGERGVPSPSGTTSTADATAGTAGTAAGSDIDTVVEAVAKAHHASPAQVRLAWTLHQGDHVLAIPGTGNLDHLAANVVAGALRLSMEELATLQAVHTAAVAGN
jgi:aryl-alcohol dehydrogenase-like predicted oxidoreductase